MKRIINLVFLLLISVQAFAESAPTDIGEINDNIIVMQTNLGDIVIELNEQRAPKTVANFKKYVETGFYTNVVFHRVISNFMIQGGGFTDKMEKKTATFIVENESIGGLPNIRGSISMARTSDPHSASSQFFINVQDNPSLDAKGDAQFGYTVFGQVIAGMDVVDQIKMVKTQRFKPPYEGAIPHFNSPIESVVIEQVYVKGQKAMAASSKQLEKSAAKQAVNNESGFVTIMFSLIAFIFVYVRKLVVKFCPKRMSCKNKD